MKLRIVTDLSKPAPHVAILIAETGEDLSRKVSRFSVDASAGSSRVVTRVEFLADATLDLDDVVGVATLCPAAVDRGVSPPPPSPAGPPSAA